MADKRKDMNQLAASVVARASGQHACSGCGATFTTDVDHPWHRKQADGTWFYWDTETPVGEPGDGDSNLAHECHGP